jgi:hypothetical protein
MSGGSLNYFYCQLDEPLSKMRAYYNDLYCPSHGEKSDKEKWELMQTFFKKIELLKGALHDIEWVMSCDYGDGDEFQAIKSFLENSFR